MNFLTKLFRSSDQSLSRRGPRHYRAYAVGDVHGRLDLLDQLLTQIDADRADRPPAKTVLVVLGDVIDRGPDSRGVVERLRQHHRDGMQMIFLLGNHEEVLLRLLDGDASLLESWLRFGGAECLRSYGVAPASLAGLTQDEALAAIRHAIPGSHRAFLRGFGDTFRFGDYLFVHAGIRPGVELEFQQQQDLRWIRTPFLEDESDHGCVVVHGHTISASVDERPNRIGIDTGAYRSGVLTAIAIEADRRWYLTTSS